MSFDTLLDRAADLLIVEAVGAMSRRDHLAADRLFAIAEIVEYEAEYFHGLGLVWRPSSGRSARSLGWLLRHDQGVRTTRRARGFWVPPVDDEEEIAA